MGSANKAKIEEKHDSAATLGFRRSWETFNSIVIIIGMLIPLFFGAFFLILYTREDFSIIIYQIIVPFAWIFALVWGITIITGFIFWAKATKKIAKKVAAIVNGNEQIEPGKNTAFQNSTGTINDQQKQDLVLFTQSDASGIAWASYKKILIPTGVAVPILFGFVMLHEKFGIELNTGEVGMVLGIVIGLDIVFILSFLGFIVSTIKTWRKMKAVNQNNAEKKEESPAKRGFRRSWEKFNTMVIISGALIPIFFGVVIFMLLFHVGEVGDYLVIPLLIIAGVFVLLWMVAFVAGIVFWRKAGKQVVNKIVPFLMEEIQSNETNSKQSKVPRVDDPIHYLDFPVQIIAAETGNTKDLYVYLIKAIAKRLLQLYNNKPSELASIYIHLGTNIVAPPKGNTYAIQNGSSIYAPFMALCAYQLLKSKIVDNKVPFRIIFACRLLVKIGIDSDEFFDKKTGLKKYLEIYITPEFESKTRTILFGETEYAEVGKLPSAALTEPMSLLSYTDIFKKKTVKKPQLPLCFFNFNLDFSNVTNFISTMDGGNAISPFSNTIDKINATYDPHVIKENAGIFIGLNCANAILGTKEIATAFGDFNLIPINAEAGISADYKSTDVVIENKGSEETIDHDINNITPGNLFNEQIYKAEQQLVASMIEETKTIGVATRFINAADPTLVIEIIVTKDLDVDMLTSAKEDLDTLRALQKAIEKKYKEEIVGRMQET